MAIIIEGSDCTGKTTFAKRLSEKTGFEVVKGSSFEISELGADGMYEHMMGLLDRDDIIIDRFLHSNLVYGRLFNYPMMKPEQYDELVFKIDETDSLLIYLHAPIEIIRWRMKKRGDDMISQEDIDDILASYAVELYADYRPDMMVSFDSSYTDFEREANLIKNIYKQT